VPVRRRGFFPDAADTRRVAAVSAPPRRLVCTAVGNARLRPARPDVPGIPGDFLARRPRLLPQVHGRRAHAVDDPQPRAAGKRLSARARTIWIARTGSRQTRTARALAAVS